MRLFLFLGACFAAAPSLAQPDKFRAGALRQQFTVPPRDQTTELPKTTSSDLPQTTLTPAATSTPKKYLIFPKGNADMEALQTMLEALIAPAVPKMIDQIKDPTGDTTIKTVLMWTALLTLGQLQEVKANSAVGATMMDEPLYDMFNDEEGLTGTAPQFSRKSKRQTKHQTRHRTRHRTRQLRGGKKLGRDPSLENIAKLPRTGDYDLTYLSTPPGASPDDTYELHKSGGEGITVYIIDRSFNLDHSEFLGGTRKLRKIDVPDNDLEVNTALLIPSKDSTSLAPPVASTMPADPDHGTCTASKAVGKTSGSAPRANLVAVAIPHVTQLYYISAMIKAFSIIIDDIKANNLRGKAVVSFSHGWKANVLNEDIWTKLLNQVTSIISMDVPIVCAAGNEPYDIDLFPQVFADQLPIINVGAADWTGGIVDFSSRGPLMTTIAGGHDIICGGVKGGYVYKSGSSYSAPLVAGMVAYWLGHPDYTDHFPKGYVAMAARNSIQNLQYVRTYKSNYAMAYNGVHNCYDEADDGFEFWPGKSPSLDDRQDPGQPPMMGLIRNEACPLRPNGTPTTKLPVETSAM